MIYFFKKMLDKTVKGLYTITKMIPKHKNQNNLSTTLAKAHPRQSPLNWVSSTLAGAVLLVLLFFCLGAYGYTVDDLANAIYKAEGGAKTRHPYGILQKYKVTTPRQACINTINSAVKRFKKQTKEKDFIHFLSLTYCPINASNDPTGLNVNWERNVKYFINQIEKEGK